MSTGMASLDEITEAVNTARNNGCEALVVLHCISGYPSPIDQSNLATIPDLAGKLGCIVGLSDHTLGTVVSISSIALGASVIEKHVTLSRKDKGPDSDFSLEPDELWHLCRETESAWKAIGNAGYERKPVEESSMKFRRSVYFVKPLKEGDVIDETHIRRIRPGYGLAPKYYDDLIGRRVTQDIDIGTATSWDLVADEK